MRMFKDNKTSTIMRKKMIAVMWQLQMKDHDEIKENDAKMMKTMMMKMMMMKMMMMKTMMMKIMGDAKEL